MFQNGWAFSLITQTSSLLRCHCSFG